MKSLALYCKSYHKDLLRAKILKQSIDQFNVDSIPFYMSVPKEDLELFKDRLGTDGIHYLNDDDIMDKHFENNDKAQQTLKANFWRLGISDVYVSIDSDSYFIKHFQKSDFMYNDTTPYTVMHECKDFLQVDARYGMDLRRRFVENRTKTQSKIGRPGRPFDYGTPPFIFDVQVWKDWDQKVLPRLELTPEEAISEWGDEVVWYGETLLTEESIKLVPIEPMFKFFHYPIQYQEYKQLNTTEAMIAENYLGIVMQSIWNAPLRY